VRCCGRSPATSVRSYPVAQGAVPPRTPAIRRGTHSMTARCAPRNALLPSVSSTPPHLYGASTHSAATSATAGGIVGSHADRKCLVFTDTGDGRVAVRPGGVGHARRRCARRPPAPSKRPGRRGPPTVARGRLRPGGRAVACRSVSIYGGLAAAHAPRDVMDWTLTEAVRAGQRDDALSQAHERLATRPRSAQIGAFFRERSGRPGD